jgi:hypothetical protein
MNRCRTFIGAATTENPSSFLDLTIALALTREYAVQLSIHFQFISPIIGFFVKEMVHRKQELGIVTHLSNC